MVENENISSDEDLPTTSKPKNVGKRGIIYLSTIPPYMNVARIKEYFGDFGEVGRVYLQLADTSDRKEKKKKSPKKFSEGWVEFNKKIVAKKVAQLLNNVQVNTRKKSKQYDCIWNIKYLSNFKWTHLHERLAYEKAAKRQKLRAEIHLAKKKTNYFTANLNKKNKDVVNKEMENLQGTGVEQLEPPEDRREFLQSLFTS